MYKKRDSYIFRAYKAHATDDIWFETMDKKKFCKVYVQVLLGRTSIEGRDTTYVISVPVSSDQKSQFGMLLEAMKLRVKDRNQIYNVLGGCFSSVVGDELKELKKKQVQLYIEVAKLIADTINKTRPHVSAKLKRSSSNVMSFESLSRSYNEYYLKNTYDWPEGFTPGAINEKGVVSLDMKALNDLSKGVMSKQEFDAITNKLEANKTKILSNITTSPSGVMDYWAIGKLRAPYIDNRRITPFSDFIKKQDKRDVMWYITREGWYLIADIYGVCSEISIEADYKASKESIECKYEEEISNELKKVLEAA